MIQHLIHIFPINMLCYEEQEDEEEEITFTFVFVFVFAFASNLKNMPISK